MCVDVCVFRVRVCACSREQAPASTGSQMSMFDKILKNWIVTKNTLVLVLVFTVFYVWPSDIVV